MNMDPKEEFFVENYSIFGTSTGKVCGMTMKEMNALKEKYKKKGVYLLPNKKFAEEAMPLEKNQIDRGINFSALQFTVASLNPLDQEQVIQTAKHMPEPKILMDQAIAIQQYRVQVGLRNEQEQGRLLDNTEAAIGNLVTMIQAKNTIEEGQEVNINVNNSISSLVDEYNNQAITIDVEKKKSVNDVLNEEAKK